MNIIAKGLEGIVANTTSISDVRGIEGRLIYSGYDISDLATSNISYEETVYLLWNGDLPNQEQLSDLKKMLSDSRFLPPAVIEFLKNAPKNANPMDIIRTGISLLGVYDSQKSDDPAINKKRAISLTAKIGIMVAYYHTSRLGKPLPDIRHDLGEAAHFLYLVTGVEPSHELAKILDTAYLLHADHGMNASTFSARVTIATLSDIYSSITSAIGTLKGPLHGGANEGVIHMLEEIGDESNVEKWIETALAGKRKIMGIGHRVYKTEDPRATHLRSMVMNLRNNITVGKWVRMSMHIAEFMKNRKGLNANVDLYSATLYHSLGLPTDMFTPIFAIARMSGWTAHVLEQLSDNRLYRPLSQYIGPQERRVVPLAERK